MMLGLAGLSMAAQAQVIASLGFEDGDHVTILFSATTILSAVFQPIK